MHNALFGKETRLARGHFRLCTLLYFSVHSSTSIKYTQDNLLIYIKYLSASNPLIVIFFAAFSCYNSITKTY